MYAICIQHMKKLANNEKSVALRRAAHRQWSLKPQDLAVALKLVALKGEWLPYAALGEVLCLSRFEAHAAIQRLGAAGLVSEVEGPPQVVKPALREFALHGARYAYPAVRGGVSLGMPTAYGVSPLKDALLLDESAVPVWPCADGKARGPLLLPLYERLPVAAEQDRDFYELLALFDALRVGRARERELARKFMEQRMQ